MSIVVAEAFHITRHLRPVPISKQTALDMYLAEPSPNFGYEIINKFTGFGYTAILLNMTSVTYLTSVEVTCSNWWHYLVIVVPEYINPAYADKAVMLIAGGSRYSGQPNATSADVKLFSAISTGIGAVGVILGEIPNQPCVFAVDPLHLDRTEDDIIAFGWRMFLNDSSRPDWLVRLPMIKSAVLAMDAVQEYLNVTNNIHISEFITAGASKRGWTTWLTGAVDSRVIGIIPIVMDELNFLANIKHHYQAYGGWSFAIEAYRSQNITVDFADPETQVIFDIEDSFIYRDRMCGIPKLMLNTSGDEFFLPDDSLWWYEQMPGEMHQRMFPNCEHSLEACILDVAGTIEAFAVGVFSNDVRPNYVWTIESTTGTIQAKQVQVAGAPQTSEVNLWTATTLTGTRRDFRLVALNATGQPVLQPVFWHSTTIQPNADGSWTAECLQPIIGWRACYLAFASLARSTFTYTFTTDVSIVPQTLPFPMCTGQACYGKLV